MLLCVGRDGEWEIPGHSAISFPFGRTAPLAAGLTLWPDVVDISNS